jgi:probable addiction module antidote protein
MPKRTGDFDAWLMKELTDPQLAAEYVNAAILEDPDLLPVVLREVAKAHTMKRVAEEAGVARESLYTSLSEAGNPTLTNLNGILKAVGLKIKVAPESEESSAQQTVSELVVESRLHIDSSVRKAIERLTKTGNISVGISQIVDPEIGYLSFKNQAGLGAYAYEFPVPKTASPGFGNVFTEELPDQGGVEDNGGTAFDPVEAYVGQPAVQQALACNNQQY